MTSQSALPPSRSPQSVLDAAQMWWAAGRIRHQIVALARARQMTPELHDQMRSDAERLEAESDRLFREAGL